jgi:LmbE family N-acetylglucosaminyl deacetylase
MEKILIFAAHPDDDILGCGGLIAKRLESGAEIKVVFFGEGTSCRYNDPSDHQVDLEKQKRNAAGIEALNSLGVNDYTFHNLPCGRLDQVPQIEINKLMESEIREFLPSTIFTHSANDTNADHRVINSCTRVATRPLPKITVKKVFSYEVLSSTEWNFDRLFRPTYFVSLDQKHMTAKLNAMSFYQSEVYDFPHPRSIQGIEILARYRGMQAGYQFAEAFSVVRMLD